MYSYKCAIDQINSRLENLQKKITYSIYVLYIFRARHTGLKIHFSKLNVKNVFSLGQKSTEELYLTDVKKAYFI